MADLKRYLTDPSLIAEGFFRQISSYSVFQNKSEFRVRVLTKPKQYSGDKVWFKGRILDPNMAHEKFLDDPCDNSIAADPALVETLVAMHSTILAGPEANVSVGDIVIATVEPGDNGTLYNLQYMRYTKTETVNEESLEVGPDCQKLTDMDFSLDEEDIISAGEPDYNDSNDPGSCPWSNGRQALSTTYDGVEIYNGFLETTGMLYTDTKRDPRIKIAKPAADNWLLLATAFEAKFPNHGLLRGSGYRTYSGQVYQRILRDGCNPKANSNYSADVLKKCGYLNASYESCGKGRSNGVAARPGTSNHGWGCAVDLVTDNWTTGGTGVESDEFIWLNKFSTEYSWILNVRNEQWHITWTRVKEINRFASDKDRWYPIPTDGSELAKRYDAMTRTNDNNPSPTTPSAATLLP